MRKVFQYFFLAVVAELAYLFINYHKMSGFLDLPDKLFTLGVLTLLLALSFFFGVERKLGLFQISGKSEGLKEALNASLLEQLGSKSKTVMVDFPLGFAFLAISIINLIAYFILL